MKQGHEIAEAVMRALQLDEAAIERRKAFLEFTDEDIARLKRLHVALRDLGPEFTRAFYDHLLRFEEIRRLIPDTAALERLKQAQAHYFDSLTAGDYGLEYTHHRLRVGVAHQRAGLAPAWYLGAYGKYLSGLLPELWQRLGKNPETFIASVRSLVKIVLLDMGLAIDTYIEADRRAILALKEYAEKVFASLPDGLLVLSQELTILSANRSFLQQFGLEPEAVRNRRLTEVVAAEGLEARVREVLESGIAQHDVPFSMGAAGTRARKPVRVTLTGIRFAEEEARLLMIVEDATEKARMQQALRESEKTFISAFEYAAIGMALVSPEGRWLKVNRSLCEVVGYSEAELLTRTFQDITHPDDLETDLQYVRQMLAGEIQTYQMEKRYLHKQGHVIWVLLSVSLVRNEVGEPLYFISQMQNITQRKKTEAELTRLAAILEQTPDFVATAAPDGRVLYFNRAARRLLGVGEQEDVSKIRIQDTHPEWASKIVLEEGIPTASVEGTWEGETAFLSRDGREILVSQVILAHKGMEGKIEYLSTIARDISEQKAQAAKIEQLAFYDPLTGLPNRALFLDRLQQALASGKRHRQRLALLFLDLDRFKEINDTQGHAIGDRVLVEAARRFQATVRGGETLARLGGDEFVVIAIGADQSAAALIAERLQKALSEPLAINGRRFTLKVSIGIAVFPEDGRTPEELRKNADIAMYRAKTSGGGYYFYRPQMSAELARKLEIARRLEAALAEGELQLHYQPQVHLASGRLAGAEALARWHDPEWGAVSPAEFIPIAEERGIIGTLGEWVLTEACRQVRRWQERQCPLSGKIAVNVSARQFEDDSFIDRCLRIARETGTAPSAIELELTESGVMRDPERAVEVTRALASAGFALAIDDFGTGYSSLAYLKRFPVHKLKIDISFVRDMLNDRSNYSIVSTIVAMGKSLQLKILAEGVEQAAQVYALQALGCDEAQGYYFDQPQPAGVFARRWLQAPSLDPRRGGDRQEMASC
ncbi:EAL domain-containing protein [Pelomicrobium sp. G1]|uniref:EAL domain-containing protein n=1 Tax=unclassified Pelomicrobium TaxID=2815318 RepID=UPI003F75DB21